MGAFYLYINASKTNVEPFQYSGASVLAVIRWGLAAMLLGLPLPVIILAFLFGGCNGR